MPQSLPASPSLQHLRNQAKALHKAVKAHDPAALARVKMLMPEISGPGSVSLANAQFVIAREHGFPSWPRLRAYVDSLTGPRAARRRPLASDAGFFEDRASGLVRSHQDAIPTTLAQIREFHPRFAGMSDEEIRRSAFTQQDAQLAVAREHGFETWRRFRRYLSALSAGKTVEPFLIAFEAMKAGSTLEGILEQDPSLVNAWGTNGNTLLNLAVACRKPAAVETLLAAGADVNRANKYGWTPLHQAAYTNQIDLARRLIEHGGRLDLSARGDGGTPLVQALFWGHRDLADELASHGVVPCNLRTTAGLGRVDLMEAFFDADGNLAPEAGRDREFYRPHPGFPAWTPSNDPQQILDEALVYASKNGRQKAVEFLLAHGAHVDGVPYTCTAFHAASSMNSFDLMDWLLEHGADVNGNVVAASHIRPTPLHDAASGGRLATVRYLVEHGADTTIRESDFEATPLDWARHFEQRETIDYLTQHQAVIEPRQ